MKSLYPYPTLFGDVTLAISTASVDGTAVESNRLAPDTRTVDLAELERAGWERAELAFEVRGPASELAERKAARCFVVLHCGHTSARQVVELARDAEDPSRWTGSVRIDRNCWFGRIDVRSAITDTVADVASRVIGSGIPWVVHLDDLPPQPVHGSITVVWEDFRHPGPHRAFLKQYGDHPTFLEIDPDDPKLFLNSSFSGLEALLRDQPRRPSAERALHDQTRAAIANEIWVALFNAVATGLAADVHGTPELPPEGWQRTVLQVLLDRMYPNQGFEEAARQLVATLGEREGAADVQQRLLPAAATQVGAPALLRSGILILGRAEERGE
jgi:hypothetical protein